MVSGEVVCCWHGAGNTSLPLPTTLRDKLPCKSTCIPFTVKIPPIHSYSRQMGALVCYHSVRQGIDHRFGMPKGLPQEIVPIARGRFD